MELELLPQNVSGVIRRKQNPWLRCGSKLPARVATLQLGGEEGQSVTGRKPGKDLVTTNQRPFNNDRWALSGRSFSEKSHVGIKADGENHARATCQDCANSGSVAYGCVATHLSMAGRRVSCGQFIVLSKNHAHNKALKAVRFAHWTAPVGAFAAQIVRAAFRCPLALR